MVTEGPPSAFHASRKAGLIRRWLLFMMLSCFAEVGCPEMDPRIGP